MSIKIGEVLPHQRLPSGPEVKNPPAVQEPRRCGFNPWWEDPPDMSMATHSSILVWRILWTETPGRPQSMGSQNQA